eukprot:TRINITY_DN59503_c0_g1_i1.p1 TRINITY_DN59503_c0_g1~~TRINITY_DN59503_c0_g1_i1.p1  ORF type:complete len:346 (-),score=81.61 TRINITY_DN59503_c0_g1_i1:99-1136(-)
MAWRCPLLAWTLCSYRGDAAFSAVQQPAEGGSIWQTGRVAEALDTSGTLLLSSSSHPAWRSASPQHRRHLHEDQAAFRSRSAHHAGAAFDGGSRTGEADESDALQLSQPALPSALSLAQRGASVEGGQFRRQQARSRRGRQPAAAAAVAAVQEAADAIAAEHERERTQAASKAKAAASGPAPEGPHAPPASRLLSRGGRQGQTAAAVAAESAAAIAGVGEAGEEAAEGGCRDLWDAGILDADGQPLSCTDAMGHCADDEEVQRRCCATCGALHRGRLQFAQGWLSDERFYVPEDKSVPQIGREQSVILKQNELIGQLQQEVQAKDTELAQLTDLLNDVSAGQAAS